MYEIVFVREGWKKDVEVASLKNVDIEILTPEELLSWCEDTERILGNEMDYIYIYTLDEGVRGKLFASFAPVSGELTREKEDEN